MVENLELFGDHWAGSNNLLPQAEDVRWMRASEVYTPMGTSVRVDWLERGEADARSVVLKSLNKRVLRFTE